MIEAKLKRVSMGPGVYLLKDAKGKVLYIGKAKVLRTRLRSHFKPGKDEEPRHCVMMGRVSDFDTIVTTYTGIFTRPAFMRRLILDRFPHSGFLLARDFGVPIYFWRIS